MKIRGIYRRSEKNQIGREGCHSSSTAKMGMRLVYWFWGNRGRREDLQVGYLDFWWIRPVGWVLG